MRALLIVLCAVVVTGAAQAHVVRQAKASLHVVRLKPLTVRGSGFKAKEKVVLRLSGAGAGIARGGFRSRLHARYDFAACSASQASVSA